jgi:predicted DCC family thiol-disulfide oxidoreductase YuxK
MAAGSEYPTSSGGPIARASRAWDRYWFGEASLVRLGVFRIVMLLTALYAVQQNKMGVFEHADGIASELTSRVWNPIYAFQVLGIEPLGPTSARVAWVALWIALWMGILGLWTRVSCAIAAALTFLWIGTSYSFGKPHHDCVALVFGLFALPLAPAGARLSIDALLARIRRTRRGGDPAEAPETAPWAALPWRLTQWTAAIGYFFAGASKVAIGGIHWANGYTLQGTMLEFNSPWTATFAQSVLLCQLMSVGLLVVQATFPLVFAWRPLRWFYVPMGAVFHLLSWMTMATGPFVSLWFTLVSFVELDRVPAFVKRHVLGGAAMLRPLWGFLVFGTAGFCAWLYTGIFHHAFEWLIVPLVAAVVIAMWPRSRMTMIYDGGCGICRATMAWVASFDWSRRVRVLDLYRWDEVKALANLDRDACIRDLHAVTERGKVLVGYDVYRAMAARLPVLFWFAPIMALPGVSHVGRRVYRYVADHRSSTTCAAPSMR